MPAPWSEGFRLRVKGKIHNQDCIQVMHFATNLAIHDPQTLNAFLQQLCTHMLGCITDELLGGVTSDYTIEGVEAVRIHPTLSDPQFVAAGAQNQGTLGTTNVSFAATQIEIRTGVKGRSGRGRNYWPPPSDNEMTQSSINTGGQAAFIAFAACVLGKFIGIGKSTPFSLGVFSRKKVNNVVQPFDDAFSEAISYSLVPLIAKMGSRKVGRGS